MRALYLILAIIGAAVPVAFFLHHFSSEGWALSRFVAALYANPAAGGFTSDLLISSFVFWAAVFQQRAGRRGPNPVWFIALNLLIGLSCALPAYLWAREGRKELV